MTMHRDRPTPPDVEVSTVPTTVPLLFTIKQAAARLGVTHYSMRNLVTTGQLPYVPVVRRIMIDPADLKELVAARKTLYTKKPRQPLARPRKRAAKSVATPEPEPTAGPEEGATRNT